MDATLEEALVAGLSNEMEDMAKSRGLSSLTYAVATCVFSPHTRNLLMGRTLGKLCVQTRVDGTRIAKSSPHDVAVHGAG